MRRLFVLLSLATACFVPAPDAFGDWPRVAISYPAANTTFTSVLTPTITLQASVSDSDEGIVGVAFFVCVASGSICSGIPSVVGGGPSSPYQFQWSPPLPSILTQTGAIVSYLVWATASNTLGQSTDSTAVPFTVVYPPGLPSIRLVEPEPQSEFVVPAAPVLYATATPGTASAGVESTIARVDFLDAGIVIASVATPNVVPAGYAFIWRNPATGPHSISARATDSLGNTTVSPAAAVYVADADQPPQVDLTSPSTGQRFGPGSIIALAATASSSEGTIERVEFVEGNAIIATSRTAPYTASWVDPPPGNFTVVAIAYDDLEAATASRPAYIQVFKSPHSPAVVLTAPTPGSTIPATVPLPLAANALAPDGSIGRVDFYVGKAIVGSASTAPYTATWASPQIGARSITAKAYDLQGFSSTSTPVSMTVTSALVPSVTVTAPASNTTFNAPATITVTATAGEPGGTLARVDFYANGNLIGSKTTAPYTVTWSNASIGGYTLSAKVTDRAGTVATAAGIPVTVLPPVPTISLTVPSSGAVYAPGQTIALSVSATTPQSAIARVEFDSDGATIQTINASAGVSTGTFSLDWTSATPGTHALTGKVYSTSGGSATSTSASVTVVDLAVALLEPAAGQVFAASTPISLTASPSETTGTIAKVEFYADGTLVGASTAPPYKTTWSSPVAGSHTITARVSDATGLSMASSAVAVTVIAMPTAQMDSGIDGGTVGDDNATISGSVQAPLNSALAINGMPAVLDPNGRFFIENLKLQPGSNTITITLNSQSLAPVVKTITLASTGIAPFEVALDKQEGLAPLTVNVTIKNRGNAPFKRITIDATDDGIPDVTLTALPARGATQSITYGTPGLYTMRVTVYDASDNPIYTATRRVRAVDPAEIGYKLASVYTTLVNQLAANNVNGALTAFVDGARDRYSSVFSALGTSLPTVAGQLGSLSNIVVMEDIGEITVTRDVGSVTQTFMIYLIRGADGVWRIETM
jgi:hypothetical protein